MDINKFLSKLFGNKSTRDMKLIQPLVETVKKAYPEIQALSNDALRAKTQEVKKYVQSSADDLKAKIAELKAKVEEMPIEDRSSLFSQIDKLEKDEVMPVVFSIVKSTAERFATQEIVDVTANDFDRELAAKFDFVDIEGDTAHYHNHWTAGGNDTVWNMIHYDVQLFGGVVLHQGKIAEMATGEGKTLVATLPVFLNALTGNGVHVVTVNDYLAKRDSEWMGPLYMFHGLSVDCIDKHQPNSDARRRAYLADITFGTNNEFGFDYLRDNMATNPKDLVQRAHNYAIVDEVDSVLIDDAQGQTIALVGESGAGKSTILNLVIGFNFATDGVVTIDGHDMRDIDLRSYRKHLAVVPQTSILFSGTIRDNITYGIDDFDEESLNKVVDAANLRDLIDSLPDGLDTVVGEHGGKLSGGQRQRVSIARALMRNPEVIVLDEATSALDSISEKLIQEALNNLTKDRTTFIVAHRLSTIKGADRIAVIADGHCVEYGTYDELMELKGEFYQMKSIQS